MRTFRNILATFLFLGTLSAFAQTTIVVNTTSPAGPGSVSEALFIANTNSSVVNPYEIVFTGLSIGDVISLSDGALPVTGDFITLNGDIDGDFRPDITIRSQFGGLSGISISGSFNTISYLNLTEFDGPPNAAIQIADGTNNRVIGNYLGTDLSGTGPAAGRNFRSISIEGGSDHIIGDGTPEGLNVISYGTWGIYIANSNSNKILGNYIGVDVTGQFSLGHAGPGIEIVDGSGNTIGGAPLVNVISGNNQHGIEINGGVGNQIIENYIGTDNSGTSAIPNGRTGILLGSSSSGNTIQDNLISGNNLQGINLSNSSGDFIYGNLIGPDITGNVDIGNNNYGIWIGSNSTSITIGDGSAANRNIISGNTVGIQISGGTNSVLGNYIGTDISGSAAITNSVGGIVVSGGVNNQIGSGGAGNLVSGNTFGIAVTVPNQTIYGNYIGTDETGTLPIPNTNQGIRLTGNASNVQVGGGLNPLNFNVISGNTQEGIILDGANVNSNFINDNFIGVGADGSTALGNGGSGILIEGNANTNYVDKATIANNGGDGIEVNGIFAVGTSFNLFSSNSYFNNTGKAISIINGAQNDILPPTIIDNQSDGLVTGTASGGASVDVYLDSDDEGEFYVGNTNADGSGNWSFTIDPAIIPPGLYNVTSVQTNNGITSEFSNAQFLNLLFTVVNTNDSGGGSLRWVIDNANSIAGKDNVIFEIPNTDPGYTNNAGEEYWTIRPLTDLPQVTESIVIDATNQPGNGKYKIRLDGQNTILTGINIGNGNSELYGLHVTRFTGVGLNMFYLGGASTIGAPGKGNLSSGNDFGIRISLADNNIIQSNIIGLDETGTIAIPNRVGMSFPSNSGGNIIGGNNADERNIISGNTTAGIVINAGGGFDIINNYIGTDITGLVAIANGHGLSIGTSGTNEIYNNVISGNNGNAFHLSLFNGAIVQGNLIGVGADGTTPLGNNRGINFWGSTNSDNNVFGGIGAGEGNIIANNTLQGVYLNTGNADFNQIIGNSIYCNGGLGIDLSLTGAIGNDGKPAPEITSVSLTTVSGTGINGETIHVYRNDSGCGPVQGAEYLGTTTVAGGVWSLSGLSLTGTEIVNATATDVNGNTSQFAVDYPEIEVYSGADNTGTLLVDDQITSVDLGSVLLGNDLDGIFTIENTSWIPLDISSITVADADFSIIGAPIVIAPNSFENFTLRLSGSTGGDFSTTVSIANEDPDESPFDFPANGTISADFVVINTNDSGAGSLRWVIENANSIPGVDNVIFDIPNTDPGYTNNAGEEFWTIRPLTQLPTISETLIIDGTLQPGTGAFKIRIDGQNSIADGLDINSVNTEIYGLHISGFTDNGIRLFYLAPSFLTIGADGKGNVLSGNRVGIGLSNGDNNIIQGNIIGLDETGTIAFPNTSTGIALSRNNLVGGANPGDRNIISGNVTRGIFINVKGNNEIRNNYIGTDISGLVAIPNGDGVQIGTSSDNKLYDNVISGNNATAVLCSFINTTIVQGNFIGVGSDGITMLGNDIGFRLFGPSNSDNNIIGGIGAGEGNIIANNTNQGIYIQNGNADFNQIIGNSIYCNGLLGIDLNLSLAGSEGNNAKSAPIITTVTGTSVIGTGVDGDIIHVYRDDSGCGPVQGGEYLGSTTVASGAWTLGGLPLTGSEIVNATATDVNGNTSQFAVDYPEIEVYSGADNSGVLLIDDQVGSVDMGSSNVGTDLDAVFTIENTSWVPMSISSVTVADTEFSIIGAPVTVTPKSFENFTLRLDGSNYGDFNSTISIANDDQDESSFDFPVNGTILVDFVVTNTNDSGIGSLRFNIEAANAIPGYNEITFNIPTADPNYDPVDERWTITPLSDLPALSEGSFLDADTQPGSASYRIILDGNSNPSLSRGLEISADDSEIDGFYVRGFDSGPINSGILISGGDRAIVGTFDGVEGNLISGNTQGVRITAGQQHFIVTNRIGLDPSGTGAEPNFYGIWVDGTATNVQIGALGYTNHVSGNIEAGIWLQGIDNSAIMNNVIGMDITGLSPLPNLIGIVMNNTDANSISDNTISGNTLEGIGLRSATNTSIFGNRIGVAVDGVTPAGNDTGITSGDGGNTVNNTIGQLAPFSPNIIAYNTNYGVLFDDVNYDFNTIAGNSIYCNGVLGIDLQGLGNDNIQAPSITATTLTSISGTGIDGETIHLYRDNSGCSPLGAEEYLGETVVSGGVWNLGGLTLSISDGLNVTATDVNGNTSEFAYSYGEIGVFEGSDNTGTEVFDAQAGAVDIGTSSIGTDLDFDFTIQNNSGAPLDISDIQSSIAEIIIIGPPSLIDPFSTSTFSVQLSGTTEGVFSGTITILSSDQDEAVFSYDVSGAIILPAPEISVYIGPDNTGTEIISGQLTAVDLGTDFYGNALQTSITIENNGIADLNVSSIFVSNVPFEITNIPAIVAIGSTATFDISVDGLTSGDFQEDVTIINDDADEGTFVFPVFASIQAAGDIVVYEGFGISGPVIQSNQATPFDLGSSEVTNDLLGNFSIQNNGNIDLNITSITSSNPAFSLSNLPSFIQSGTGNVAFIDISLNASTPGVASTTITIVNDDPDQSIFVFDMVGEITAPALQLFEGSGTGGTEVLPNTMIDLGTTNLETDLTATFTILNSGTSDLQVSSIDSDNILYSVAPANFTVSAGVETAFTVILDASSAGIYNARLNIVSNDLMNSTFSFDLTAEVLAPVITLRENSQSGGVIDENTPIDVGTVPRSTNLEKTFVIENVGNQILNIQDIIIDNPSFQVIDAPTSINAGDFAEFTVVFFTEELGIQQGTVTITTDVGTFTFFVTANVVDIVLYNVLSPNGDGVHDFLKIENIEFFPSNTVYIYTRWGDAIFKMDGYDNNNNVFDGIANQSGISDVAEGTYYYVVVYEYTNAQGEAIQNTITGFFLIKRDL